MRNKALETLVHWSSSHSQQVAEPAASSSNALMFPSCVTFLIFSCFLFISETLHTPNCPGEFSLSVVPFWKHCHGYGPGCVHDNSNLIELTMRSPHPAPPYTFWCHTELNLQEDSLVCSPRMQRSLQCGGKNVQEGCNRRAGGEGTGVGDLCHSYAVCCFLGISLYFCLSLRWLLVVIRHLLSMSLICRVSLNTLCF